MRLVCPHCMGGVTVADDTAGKETTCPTCGKSFPTPARYTPAVVPEAAAAVVSAVAAPPAPSVAPLAPPPGLVPPAADGFATTTPQQTAINASEGYTRSCGITISPCVVAWLPAVLLTVVLVSTFFPWVGSYADGAAIYSQRPWGAMFNSPPYRNHQFEEVMPPSTWIDKKPGDWKLMLPFFLLFFVAFHFAWVDRVFDKRNPQHGPLAKLWPRRHAIVAITASLALLLLIVQAIHGFGMERAIQQQIREQFADIRAKDADSPEKQAHYDYREQMIYKAYNLEQTSWMCLALWCIALTVLAAGTRIALDRRGNKPPPKILMHY